jgi:hypothetical protein
MKPNKALQPTPSRDVPASYERPASPFTSLQSSVAFIGVAELDVRLL